MRMQVSEALLQATANRDQAVRPTSMQKARYHDSAESPRDKSFDSPVRFKHSHSDYASKRGLLQRIRNAPHHRIGV